MTDLPIEDDYVEPPLKTICRHLRSKSMFVAGLQEPTPDMLEMGGSPCWCNLTQQIYGMDDQLVGRRECDDARSCYEAAM